MKLYGDPGSVCTRKVLAVLAEKGHDAEFILVSVKGGEHKKPEHLVRQPFGVVPALEDDGFLMYESRAIMRYLDQKLPGPALTPTNLQDRTRMDQWMSVEQSYFSGPAMKAILQMLGKFAGREPDMNLVEQGKAGVAKPLDVMAKHLEANDYLAGKQFTLADISWAPYVQRFMDFGIGDVITERPAVAAWWQRVSSRPAWNKAIAR
jgi:glutathione S-transferase